MKTKWLFLVTLMLFVLLGCIGCSHSNIKQKDQPQVIETKPIIPISTEKPKEPEIEIKEVKFFDGIMPAKLYIPTLGVQANIEPVDVLSNGQMGIPSKTDEVGFLSSGTLPGEAGNAVMDGHVDTYTGPAVFFRLNKLKTGDIVIVTSNKGSNITFAVESVELFANAEAPIPRIFGPSQEARLNLITCAGKYSRGKKEHEARLVVFTKRVSETYR